MARGGRRIGQKQEPTSKYAYGDPQEVSNRDKTAFQPRATAFKQISPDDRGGTLNEPPHQVRSGNFKFSKPVS